MNLKTTLIYLSIFMNCFCLCNVSHSSDDEEYDLGPKVINPIDIEWCQDFANKISEDAARYYFADYNEEEEKQRNQEHLDALNLYISEASYNPIIESDDAKEKRIQREKEVSLKLAEEFIAHELEIKSNALAILSEYPESRRKYKRLIKDKGFASLAILELTKDIDAQPRALELLKLIEYYWDDQYRPFHDEQVSLEASSRIFHYYLDRYNERASLVKNPNKTDRNLHDLLKLCRRHTPDSVIDICDPEFALTHIIGAIDTQLLRFNLGYINNPRLMSEIVNLYSLNRIFKLGVNFLQCTTYGLACQYFDLGYLLKSKDFIGIKLPCPKAKGQYQHLWVHPHLPLQVRITEKGKLTAGLLKKNPLALNKRLTKDSVPEDNELYKISLPELAPYVISARCHTEEYRKLWKEDAEAAEKEFLMDKAHIYLEPANMNFIGMEKFLYAEQPEESTSIEPEVTNDVKSQDNNQNDANGKKPKKRK